MSNSQQTVAQAACLFCDLRLPSRCREQSWTHDLLSLKYLLCWAPEQNLCQSRASTDVRRGIQNLAYPGKGIFYGCMGNLLTQLQFKDCIIKWANSPWLGLSSLKESHLKYHSKYDDNQKHIQGDTQSVVTMNVAKLYIVQCFRLKIITLWN